MWVHGHCPFMPSSYRAYAVDFSEPKDNKIDLSNSMADAIGSVGNYLKQHGWQKDKPIAFPVSGVTLANQKKLFQNQKIPWETLKKHGIRSSKNIAPTTTVTLLDLELLSSREYWAMCDNFRVIMSYNPRPLYAMAVISSVKNNT